MQDPPPVDTLYDANNCNIVKFEQIFNVFSGAIEFFLKRKFARSLIWSLIATVFPFTCFDQNTILRMKGK